MRKLPSAKQVENWKTPGRHAVGLGVYLQVSGSNGRSWLFRFQHNRRAHHIGLGPVAEVSLAEARNKALRYRQMLREEGINPLAARVAARARTLLEAARGITFQQCADRYIAAHEPAWRSAVHRKQWVTSLKRYVYPVFGNLPVAAIDTALVTQALEPIWTTKPATAMRVRGRIELVLDWAKARGYRDGDNPGRWRGHLDKLLPSRLKVRQVRHYAALPYTELPALMAELRKRDDLGARALEFTILTGCRTNEVLHARWDEIHHDIWIVPASRMKHGKEHRVALSGRALEILGALPRSGEFIFPGRSGSKPVSHPVLLTALHRLGRSDLTAHGFRSTLRDWISECTNYPREVAEAALAHTVKDPVERAYRRGDLFDKRRRLMAEWARYCAAPAKSGAVVRLRR